MPRNHSFTRNLSGVRQLTPVSEADSDVTETTHSTTNQDSSSSATSSGSSSSNDQIFLRPPPPNFSRPRPLKNQAQHQSHKRAPPIPTPDSITDTPSVYTPTAQHDPIEDFEFPNELIFGFTEDRKVKGNRKEYEQVDQDLGATSPEFEWDTHLMDMKPLHKQPAGLPEALSDGVRTPSSMHVPSQHKSTHNNEVEQDKEGSDWDGDDAKSHHTVSEAGSSEDTASWQSVAQDISSILTPKEVKKLKRKGISPTLYLEMKAARNGRRRWINPLVGNTYLS